MHLPWLLACTHAGTMLFVKKMAARPGPGARAANTLQATMDWSEDPGFQPCFNTQVADATFLYGAYRSLDVLFISETRAESRPRFDAARAHLPRDEAEVPVHPAFCEFKQRFMKFCAHFGYTHPHPFPVDGDAVGHPPPPPGRTGRGGAVPFPTKNVPGPIAAEPAPRTAHHASASYQCPQQ